MLGIEARRSHRALEIKAEPFLDPQALQFRGTLGKIEEQHEIEHDRRRQNRVAAQEIDLDLHGIAEPSEDIDVIPTFFVITAWRVIVNADLVCEVPVQVGVKLGLQDVLQHRKLGLFLGLERARILQHFAVPVAQDVRREPTRQSQHAGFKPWRQDGLD